MEVVESLGEEVDDVMGWKKIEGCCQSVWRSW